MPANSAWGTAALTRMVAVLQPQSIALLAINLHPTQELDRELYMGFLTVFAEKLQRMAAYPFSQYRDVVGL